MIAVDYIPEGVTILVAGYNDGRMIAVQMVENITGDIVVDAAVWNCTSVKLFFVDPAFAALCETLIVNKAF